MSYIGLSTLFKLVLYRRLHTILYVGVGPTIKCDDFNFWSTTSLARYKAVKFTQYDTVLLPSILNLIYVLPSSKILVRNLQILA